METMKRYEQVINEALRSALNYDTPDDQINEFIGFFGKHIGSDRIYIFEDSEERHATDNTYEWCADGVIPEINELQNVDMDIIDMKHFPKERVLLSLMWKTSKKNIGYLMTC